MSAIQEKLDRGLNLLAQAGDDPDILGLALQSIHGALEDYFRNLLSKNNALTPEQGNRIQNRDQTQWQELLDLMQQYDGLSESDRALILRMNHLCNEAAQGNSFSGNRTQIEQYADYVQKRIHFGASSTYTVYPTQPIKTKEEKSNALGASLDANQWAMFLHLSLLAGFVAPYLGLVLSILIWQLKKQEFPQLDVHGKNMANWEISKFIYAVVFASLTFVLIGFPFVLALLVCTIIFPIIAGLKASNGEVWQYPLAIRFLK